MLIDRNLAGIVTDRKRGNVRGARQEVTLTVIISGIKLHRLNGGNVVCIVFEESLCTTMQCA
jgi:hypothetical protein